MVVLGRDGFPILPWLGLSVAVASVIGSMLSIVGVGGGASGIVTEQPHKIKSKLNQVKREVFFIGWYFLYKKNMRSGKGR